MSFVPSSSVLNSAVTLSFLHRLWLVVLFSQSLSFLHRLCLSSTVFADALSVEVTVGETLSVPVDHSWDRVHHDPNDPIHGQPRALNYNYKKLETEKAFAPWELTKNSVWPVPSGEVDCSVEDDQYLHGIGWRPMVWRSSGASTASNSYDAVDAPVERHDTTGRRIPPYDGDDAVLFGVLERLLDSVDGGGGDPSPPGAGAAPAPASPGGLERVDFLPHVEDVVALIAATTFPHLSSKLPLAGAVPNEVHLVLVVSTDGSSAGEESSESTDGGLRSPSAEAYALKIAANRFIAIAAHTRVGLLYGLESLAQLVKFDFVASMYYLPRVCSIKYDEPRYPHRGLMIDSARHYLPLGMRNPPIDDA